MKGNVNYLELANSPLMWVGAAIAVGIVVFQSVLFFRKSLKAAKEIGIEQEKINMAIKSSAISSIGPSIVILVTMISLIVSMGAPVSWMRLSFIGSVNYEAMAAGFGAQAMGATLENLTPVAFACGVWTMICGSLGWLIFTLLFTDKMDKVNHLISKGNSKMVPIISAGAMLENMEIAKAHSLSHPIFFSFANFVRVIIRMHPTIVAIAGAPPNAN